jgi:hypothetical protein
LKKKKAIRPIGLIRGLLISPRSEATLFASFSGKRNSLDQLAWFGAYVILMAFREAEQRFLLLSLEKEESH